MQDRRKTYWFSPKRCWIEDKTVCFTPTPNKIESKRTMALNFKGSNREWRKLFRSLGSIGIDFLPKTKAKANLIGHLKLLAGTSTDPLTASITNFTAYIIFLMASLIILTASKIILTASKSTLTASTVTLTASTTSPLMPLQWLSRLLQAPSLPLQSLSRPL